MQPSYAITTVPFGSYNILATRWIVKEVELMWQTPEEAQLPQVLKYNYRWHSEENKRQTLESVEKLRVICAMHLALQIKTNVEQIVYWLTKDIAERLHGLAVRRLNYPGEIRVERHVVTGSQTFRVLISEWANVKTEWVFQPLEQFAGNIPLHALKAINTFEKERMTPDAYWVADKIHTVTAVPRSIDPILCGQSGHWFAGIAFWL